MGGDGGSIPGRCDIIKVRGYGFKRNLGGMGYDPNTLVFVGDGKLSLDEVRELAFTRCHVSQEELSPPLVLDSRGMPYNKAALLKLLIDRALPEDVMRVVKRVRDTCQIYPPRHDKKTPFPAFDEAEKRLQCQLTGIQCNGKGQFWFSWKCGCIFSNKAAVEVCGRFFAAEKVCPVCGEKNTDIKEMIPRKLHRSGEPKSKRPRVAEEIR